MCMCVLMCIYRYSCNFLCVCCPCTAPLATIGPFFDVYICLLSCVCVYMCVLMCIYEYICVIFFVYKGTNVFFYVCVLHIQPHLLLLALSFMSIYVYMMCMYVYVCTHVYIWVLMCFFLMCVLHSQPHLLLLALFFMCTYVDMCTYVYTCVCVYLCLCMCMCVLRVPPHLLLLAPSVMCIDVCVCTPPQNPFRCRVSTPYTLFCLIFTISSELNDFQIFTDLSEPGSISDGFQWTGSIPAGFQEYFRAVCVSMCVCGYSTRCLNCYDRLMCAMAQSYVP